MIVSPSTSVPAVPFADRTAGASAAGFSVPRPAAAAATAVARPAAAGAVCMAPLESSLLLFQEWSGNERDDRDAREHAGSLLDALRELQRALLSAGTDPAAAAARLRALLDAAPVGGDPRLRDLLRSVSLRARIELQRAVTAGGDGRRGGRNTSDPGSDPP